MNEAPKTAQEREKTINDFEEFVNGRLGEERVKGGIDIEPSQVAHIREKVTRGTITPLEGMNEVEKFLAERSIEYR